VETTNSLADIIIITALVHSPAYTLAITGMEILHIRMYTPNPTVGFNNTIIPQSVEVTIDYPYTENVFSGNKPAYRLYGLCLIKCPCSARRFVNRTNRCTSTSTSTSTSMSIGALFHPPLVPRLTLIRNYCIINSPPSHLLPLPEKLHNNQAMARLGET
jgi:hypothetical protein